VGLAVAEVIHAMALIAAACCPFQRAVRLQDRDAPLFPRRRSAGVVATADRPLAQGVSGAADRLLTCSARH
jgi:hypothetical protein